MSFKYIEGIGDIIRDRCDIVDVIGSYITLEKAGRNFKARCPFHTEKTASFVVSREKQMYKCFGCGKGGGLINFVMEYENLDFLNAIEVIAEKTGFSLEPYRNKENSFSEGKKLDPYYELNVRVAKDYFQRRESDERANDYLLKRGLTLKTIRRFGLGYSNDSWDDVLNKYSGEFSSILNDSGLFVKKEGGGYYNRFRGRLMFPIFDLRKRVIGFGARAMGDEMPKYLNSPDTPVFDKSLQLYGLHQAKNHLKGGVIFLVEGYMDVLSMSNVGIHNAVASLGTSLTLQQASLLSKYAKEVIILYDGDSAGQQATLRAIEILKDEPVALYAVHLPEEMDPDDYLKKMGKDSLLAYVQKYKMDAQLYRLKNILEAYDMEQTSEKYRGLKAAVDYIETLQNEVDKKKCSDFLVEKGIISSSEKDSFFRQLKNQNALMSQKKKPKRNLYRQSALSCIALLLGDQQILREAAAHPYYSHLPTGFREVINFAILHDGYDPIKASEVFTLDLLNFVDEGLKTTLHSKDRENWKVIFERFLIESLRRELSLMKREDYMDDESYYEERMKIQQMVGNLQVKGEI